MAKKIVIDKEGIVISTEETAALPNNLHRCPICSEPLDPDAPHECNPLTLGKTVFHESEDEPAIKDDDTEQAIFGIICPICKGEHDLSNLYDHVMGQHKGQSYYILYTVQIACPFCRDTFSVSRLAFHLGGCKHKPPKGRIRLQLRSTLSKRINPLDHWIKTSSDQ